jgi:phage baseplate assembly protein W
MRNVGLPFHFDTRGRTAEPGDARTSGIGTPSARRSTHHDDAHVRDLIEQVLFTAPGERVNRPDFGTGLLQLLFAPNSDTLASATQLLVRGALQQWLGEVIQVEDVRVEAEDSTLRVTVEYIVTRTQEREAATFLRQGVQP